MTAFILAALGLCVLAAALITRPLWISRWKEKKSVHTDEVDELLRQLGQLEELHEKEVLTAEQFAAGKASVERKVLDAVLKSNRNPDDALPIGPSSTRLGAALAVFLFAIAGAGYWWIGSPGSLELVPGSTAGVASASGDDAAAPSEGGKQAHALSIEKIQAMIDQLNARLKTQPDDADSWQMLARSYVAIGKHEQSLTAFKEAVRLKPADADLLADYADALAVNNNRSLEGEAGKLVERALKADPKNAKALALAGTGAFDKHDYKAAIAYWSQLADVEPAGTPFAEQVRANIDEARQLAGLPAAPSPAASAARVAASTAQVSGTVSLSPALTGRVAPDDTLFVFARAVDGQRMPLGVLRKRVRDLPLQFRIDDDSAMSPEAKLSGATHVAVIARISKSGSASPQPGDLQGLASDVLVGASGLKIDIDQEIAK